jgi:hypothetical protein
MGAVESVQETIRKGLDEVETKGKWRIGITIDVRWCGRFAVTDIVGVYEGHPGELREGNRAAGVDYIYTYPGTQVVAPGVATGVATGTTMGATGVTGTTAGEYPMYDIYLKRHGEILGAGSSRGEHSISRSSGRFSSRSGRSVGWRSAQRSVYSDATVDILSAVKELPNFTQERKFTIRCRPCARKRSQRAKTSASRGASSQSSKSHGSGHSRPRGGAAEPDDDEIYAASAQNAQNAQEIAGGDDSNDSATDSSEDSSEDGSGDGASGDGVDMTGGGARDDFPADNIAEY